MHHEKTVVSVNGDKIRIRVSFWVRIDKPVYDVRLFICKKGKRTFQELSFDGDYAFRALSLPEREIFRQQEFRNYVTEEQILAAKQELWKKLAPGNEK